MCSMQYNNMGPELGVDGTTCYCNPFMRHSTVENNFGVRYCDARKRAVKITKKGKNNKKQI